MIQVQVPHEKRQSGFLPLHGRVIFETRNPLSLFALNREMGASIGRMTVLGVAGRTVSAERPIEGAYRACTASDCDYINANSNLSCRLQDDICVCRGCQDEQCYDIGAGCRVGQA